MKPQFVKKRKSQFNVRLEIDLIKRVNEARLADGRTWPELFARLFERYLCEVEIAQSKGKKK